MKAKNFRCTKEATAVTREQLNFFNQMVKQQRMTPLEEIRRRMRKPLPRTTKMDHDENCEYKPSGIDAGMDSCHCNERRLEAENARLRVGLKYVQDNMLAVLCDPEGKPRFRGSDGDRGVIANALARIDELLNKR